MSHISVYKTSVKIHEETLRKAVEKLAKKIGVETRGYVTDYYGNIRSVSIALVSNDLPRGIGFSVKDGELVIVGDSYGYEHQYREYGELVKNYINAYITRRQTYKLYPTAKIRERIRGTVVELEVEI